MCSKASAAPRSNPPQTSCRRPSQATILTPFRAQMGDHLAERLRAAVRVACDAQSCGLAP